MKYFSLCLAILIYLNPILNYSYSQFEKVEIYANHIQPYENPTETYKQKNKKKQFIVFNYF